jgi:carbon monoxide dehydrogenase subunit G
MILSNEVVVNAPPGEVFALINDVERVVTCLPGASVGGGDGTTYQGGVKVKVGPISAAYTGTVHFAEVDHGRHYLRLQARGTDTRGNGDAEAEVNLTVEPTAAGSLLRMETDLVIRGKIAQFGKGAIKTVSDKLLQQFADNLAGLLDQDRAGTAAHPSAGTAMPARAVPAAPSPSSPGELDGMALLLGPNGAKYASLAGAFALGLAQGWLLTKLCAQRRLIKELRRG